MTAKRIYTAQEIRELVEIFRNAPDISREKFSGMEFVAGVCEQFERMSDTDIETMARRLYHRV